MPVDFDALFSVLCQLCDEADLRVSVKESLKGGFITGGASTIGGVVAGPIGIAIGGALGGVIAAYSAWGKFQPVSMVILNMEEEKKQKLYSQTLAIIGDISSSDIVELTALLAGNTVLKQQLIDTVKKHIENQLQLKIID